MKFYESLLKWKSRIYDNFLIHPKIVRLSIISALVTFVTFFTLGFIVAQFDPDGYNIVSNYISDMGSFQHTPMPYFLDYGAMCTSILIIPAIFYLETILAPIPVNSKKFDRMRYRLSGLGFFFMMMGFFGFFMIGLFSEDRTTSLDLHFFFSYVVFAGLVFSSVFYGLLIIFYNTTFPKPMGLYMTIIPFITGSLMFIYMTPFFEWIMFISLIIWMIPTFFIVLKHLNKETPKKNE
jgi:hypothetical protein